MKTIKYIAAFLPLASLLVSCNDDFLDRYPQDSVTNETYWKTEEQLRAALYPCYETFEYTGPSSSADPLCSIATCVRPQSSHCLR